MTKEIIKLDRPFAQGSEHRVCMSPDDPEHVYKVPFAWWHSKGAQALKREIDILLDNGVPILETQVFESPVIEIEGQNYTPSYVLRQKKCADPTLNTNHLNVQYIRAQLARLLQTSVNLFHDKRMAIDFLGAEAVTGFLKYFRHSNYPLHVYNFRLDNKAQMVLSDTGMLRPDKCKAYLRWGISEKVSLQHIVIERVLQTLEPEFQLENFAPSGLVKFTGTSLLTLTSAWAGMKSY